MASITARRMSFVSGFRPRLLCTRSCDVEPYVTKLNTTSENTARLSCFEAAKIQNATNAANGQAMARITWARVRWRRSSPRSESLGARLNSGIAAFCLAFREARIVITREPWNARIFNLRVSRRIRAELLYQDRWRSAVGVPA